VVLQAYTMKESWLCTHGTTNGMI